MRTILLAVVAAIGGACVYANLQEEKIAIDKLPKAVVEAVKARFDGVELKGAEKEMADGKTVYEVNIKHKGRTADVLLTEEGHFLVIETLITDKDLPKAVAATLTKKYPGAKVTKTEELMNVSYEVLIKVGDKTMEVKLDPSGKVLEEEKKDGDKDDKN